MDLSNKVVLVTGSNRGIGQAIVTQLLTRGVKKVYAAARNKSSLDFNDSRVETLELDITNKDQVVKAAQIASDVNILINNAGTAAFANLLSSPLDHLEADMNVNYYGTLSMMRAFVPILEKNNGGAIVNVVTIAAFVNFPMVGGYSASKSALFSATQGIRIELKHKNISVHTVNPGPIDTDMAKEFPMEKETPLNAAENILIGLENDVEDIFPDAAGENMFNAWNEHYKNLEHMVSDMIHQEA